MRSSVLGRRITDLIMALDQLIGTSMELDLHFFCDEVTSCYETYRDIVDARKRLDTIVDRYILQVNMILGLADTV